MRKAITLTLFTLFAGAAEAIIYRHDVSEEKFRMLGEQSQFECVGKVIDSRNHIASGSCVLIGDKYVLTAAHLFVASDIVNDTTNLNGTQLVVFKPINSRLDDITKYDFRFNRIRYRGKKMMILPDYMNKDTYGTCDLAIIELEEPVTNCKPASLCQRFDELNALGTLVGYGVSGKANMPQEVDEYGYKLAGQNMIDSLGGYVHNGQPALLVFDFDHPDMPEYNISGSKTALSLESICGGGDSGGGMFRQRKDGNWELIGICTGANTDIAQLLKIGYYGNSASYTRVSVFYDWIQSVMRK